MGKGAAEEKSRDFWDIISANRVFANSGHVMGGSFVFFSLSILSLHTHTHMEQGACSLVIEGEGASLWLWCSRFLGGRGE